MGCPFVVLVQWALGRHTSEHGREGNVVHLIFENSYNLGYVVSVVLSSACVHLHFLYLYPDSNLASMLCDTMLTFKVCYYEDIGASSEFHLALGGGLSLEHPVKVRGLGLAFGFGLGLGLGLGTLLAASGPREGGPPPRGSDPHPAPTGP